MAAAGDIVTFACRTLPALVKLGRPVLLKLQRRASGRCARARTELESMSPLAPLHQFEAVQARVRRAAEAVTKYGDALRLLDSKSRSSTSSP